MCDVTFVKFIKMFLCVNYRIYAVLLFLHFQCNDIEFVKHALLRISNPFS
jgi:uncharacterized membrane protein YesL